MNRLADFLKYGIFFSCTMVLNSCAAVTAEPQPATQAAAVTSTPLGLYVNSQGLLMHAGLPFRGIGVNYFDAFSRDNSTYLDGFAYLHNNQIPYIRFMAEPGFWPNDFKQYSTNKQAYFQRLDAFVHNAENYGIGLIPSLFWNPTAVSDFVGEPRNQWANPASKTMNFMRTYTQEVVTRYKDSPAIWGWEFSNEMNAVDMDRLQPAIYRAGSINTNNGTPLHRTADYDMTTDQYIVAVSEFANTVRRFDKQRIILSGNNIASNNQYNRYMFRDATVMDTKVQYSSLLAMQNPDPVNTFTIHIYPDELNQYFVHGAFGADIISVSMQASVQTHKPLNIEEFGTSKLMGDSNAKAVFEQLLANIVKARVPLASLWVYDFSAQNADWNITQTNSRAYQLVDIINANKKIRSELGL